MCLCFSSSCHPHCVSLVCLSSAFLYFYHISSAVFLFVFGRCEGGLPPCCILFFSVRCLRCAATAPATPVSVSLSSLYSFPSFSPFCLSSCVSSACHSSVAQYFGFFFRGLSLSLSVSSSGGARLSLCLCHFFCILSFSLFCLSLCVSSACTRVLLTLSVTLSAVCLCPSLSCRRGVRGVSPRMPHM